jgi:hypothetical protein
MANNIKKLQDKLDLVAQAKITEAAFNDRENPIDGDDAKEYYDAVVKLDKMDQYDLMEETQDNLTTKIIDDNIDDAWFDEPI